MKSHIKTFRVTEEEYRKLTALSMLDDEPISHVIRRAIHSYAKSVVESPDYPAKVQAARDRIQQKEAELREALGLDPEPPKAQRGHPVSV